MDVTTTPSNLDGAPTYVENTDPLEHQRKHLEQARQVPAWGVDKNPEDRPAYPMERTPPRLANPPAQEPEHQHANVKIHHSTERPGITPVFGTSAPPSGVSGRMRDLAFKYSENDLRHWLILLGADRVNVVEGLVDDLAHGHVPNLWKEMGLAAEWKHNRAGLVRKAMVLGAVAGVAVWALSRRNRRH